jgi:nucleotide-binding universal stress UspA family protein
VSTILIGVDASERSEDAVAFGRRLATASGAGVLLACAFPYEDTSRSANAVYREYLRADAQETVARLSAGLEGVPPDRVETHTVPRLSPARALHEVAAAVRPAIVIVGSTHRGHLGRVLPGSTGERLLHGSPCPVAIVPSGYRTHAEQPVRRIGVGVDGSAEARAALAAAAELARALGAHLEVIGVQGADGYAAPAMMAGPGYDAMVEDILRRQREALAEAVAGVPADVDAEAVALTGGPAKELIARSERLDLLIVGSRGYGPLRSVLVGGVSGEVVRAAHCPVIAVPRGVDAPLAALFTAAATAA